MTNSVLTYRRHLLELRWNSSKFFIATAPAKEFKAVNNSIPRMIWVIIYKLEANVQCNLGRDRIRANAKIREG